MLEVVLINILSQLSYKRKATDLLKVCLFFSSLGIPFPFSISLMQRLLVTELYIIFKCYRALSGAQDAGEEVKDKVFYVLVY